jgi:hypothetical protein
MSTRTSPVIAVAAVQRRRLYRTVGRCSSPRRVPALGFGPRLIDRELMLRICHDKAPER